MSFARGSFVMMQLGSFQFGIRTAAYQELTRETEYRWAEHEIFGALPRRQFTGAGNDSINLQGVILPEYRGGFGQLDSMRALAATGKPLSMVSGSGAIMGRWCIEKITEGQKVFAAYGRPRHIDFTLQLKRFE